jgi:hypothetical protein
MIGDEYVGCGVTIVLEFELYSFFVTGFPNLMVRAISSYIRLESRSALLPLLSSLPGRDDDDFVSPV